MKPQRTFSADVGQTSVDERGPDAIERDFDNINKMFDPSAVHADGSQGGIGKENLNFSFGSDVELPPIDGLPDPDDPSQPAGNITDQILALYNLITGNDLLVVHKAGAETVTGVKTFNAAPVVPIPTASTQAASKGYVDEQIGALPDNVPIIGDDGKINPVLLPDDIISGGGSGYSNILDADRLNTSYKISNYLKSDTSDVNYIKIYNERFDFITAKTDGSETVQVRDRNNELVYWTDAEHTDVTLLNTDRPVLTYVYTELIKNSFSFVVDAATGYYVPKITLGAGVGNVDHPDWGKGWIYKGPDGLYIEYISTTGLSRIIKLTDDGIDLTQFEAIKFSETVQITGLPRIWVQPDAPVGSKDKDIWVDTDDYSRYDAVALSSGRTLIASDPEIIIANGTFTITLHAATTAGVIKKIYNSGTGLVTVIPPTGVSLNGVNNGSLLLYPNESAEFITDGSGWRY